MRRTSRASVLSPASGYRGCFCQRRSYCAKKKRDIIDTIWYRAANANSGAKKWSTVLLPSTPTPIGPPEQLASFFAALYSPMLYAYCSFSMVDIFHEARLLGHTELLQHPSQLLVSPFSLSVRPAGLLALGPARHEVLLLVLLSLLQKRDKASFSLCHCLREEQLLESNLLPLFRGIALCIETRHAFAPQAAHVTDSLLNAAAALAQRQHMFLIGHYNDRCCALANLLLSTAQEFGSISLLTDALHMYHVAGRSIDYALSKKMACITAWDERRELDWAVRCNAGFRKGLVEKWDINS